MSRQPKHEWISLRCPVCGNLVHLPSGHLEDHDGLNGAACPAAGHAAEMPPVSTKRAYLCAECGQRTYSNLRSGIVFSHNLTGRTEVCRSSGRFLGPIGLVVEAVLVQVRATRGSLSVQKKHRSVNYDGPSTSVRTVGGGLPGHGKRS
jgi:DNA-directed RNA polymerase subunit RPC12/RpoP